MSGGICPRGYLSRGVSVQGVSVQEGICPGVSVRGVHVPGGGGVLCPRIMFIGGRFYLFSLFRRRGPLLTVMVINGIEHGGNRKHHTLFIHITGSFPFQIMNYNHIMMFILRFLL